MAHKDQVLFVKVVAAISATKPYDIESQIRHDLREMVAYSGWSRVLRHVISYMESAITCMPDEYNEFAIRMLEQVTSDEKAQEVLTKPLTQKIAFVPKYNIKWDAGDYLATVFLAGETYDGELHADGTITAETPFHRGISDVVDAEDIDIVLAFDEDEAV